jgi:hypothetical protein
MGAAESCLRSWPRSISPGHKLLLYTSQTPFDSAAYQTVTNGGRCPLIASDWSPTHVLLQKQEKTSQNNPILEEILSKGRDKTARDVWAAIKDCQLESSKPVPLQGQSKEQLLVALWDRLCYWMAKSANAQTRQYWESVKLGSAASLRTDRNRMDALDKTLMKIGFSRGEAEEKTNELRPGECA